MIKKLLLSGCLLTLIAGGAAYEYVHPRSPFDPVEAQEKLAPGSAHLSGHLSRSDLANVRVALYPQTAHFEEYLDLQNSTSREPYRVPALDDGARHCRLVVEAKDGQFSFHRIKPGTYYLEYPAKYNPGDSPEIDEIFAQGGCVYFTRSQMQSVELPATGLSNLTI